MDKFKDKVITMNLTKLNHCSVNLKDFVDFWSSCYHDQSEKNYSERINNTTITEEDLRLLFEWKNGGNLSQRKTQTLQEITRRIDVINCLKNNFSLDKFLGTFDFVNGVIWKIFLLHIICPDSYPIVDQHVYRAYLFISKNQRAEIPNNKRQKEAVYFSEYVPFFNSLSGPNIDISKKKLDEALWAYGKFLKTPYGNKME
ncbi:MAG: hypothetical protein AABY51_04580 [Deltaproteobacteria bacterium]